MTFPFKIPPALLDIPLLGFFNFHFSLLPAYRGPDPVFWQLKNLEPGTGITLHRMNRYFDRGEIVLQQPMPIVAGETHARCSNRLAMASVGMLNEFLNYIRQDHKEVTLVNQPSEGASYQSRPTFHDVIIRWQHQAAAEIIALVCACNPHYQGAITILRGVSLRLLEAVPLELPDIQAPPGTIVMADGREGIGVLCKDGKGVLIKVLLADDGYVSGSHLALLGIQPGEQFADYAEPTP